MKLNYKAGLAVLLGLVTARIVFHLTGWTYNLFHDPFSLWSAILQLGVPAALGAAWYWILQAVFKPKPKPRLR
jgi:hypothetical protein